MPFRCANTRVKLVLYVKKVLPYFAGELWWYCSYLKWDGGS